MKKYSWKCLDASALKILAMVCMLLDHAEGTIVFDQDWMSCVGRLAFPIFAFQIAQGYRHTSDFRKYLKRLAVYALISEIPYNLMHGNVLYPMGQNVLFTFCLSLLVIRLIDRCRTRHWLLGLLALIFGAAGGYYLSFVLMMDYMGYGVLMVLSFWLFDRGKLGWLLQLVAMVYINCCMIGGYSLTFFLNGQEIWVPVQCFAALAMIPILMYSGKKGIAGKAFQKGVYLFYPAHMLALSLMAAVL